ncbi:hypothetical protein ATOP_12250 [Granulimonas faecalis]|uniref:GAF domain-containing protein n=1 Tax=Granulimonas faecalis TaxID=2894155 RepID=A0AAV5B446_9ACTN|nr:hypothetical protein [Granulimonas faecalis]GJM55570.1 hypothetical protein ATOP_12250 [Granulimonas faecalis]
MNQNVLAQAIAQVVRTDPKTYGAQLLSLSPSKELFEAVRAVLGEPFDEEDFYGALKEAVGLCAEKIVAASDDPWHAAVDCYLFDPAVECTAVGEASDGSPVFRYMDVGGHYLDQIAVRCPDAGDGKWGLPEAESFFTLPGGFQAAHV